MPWSLVQVGVRLAYWRGVSVAPVPAVAVGVAPAPAVASVFQLPSHCEPPQTTVHECCERHKRTVRFPTQTQRILRNISVKKRTAVFCFPLPYTYHPRFWFWFSKWQSPPKDVVPHGSHREQQWQNVQCGSSA